MSPLFSIGIISAYFAVLIGIAYITSRHADTNDFFTANKQAPWYLVAFGMIGASISGVTFISVPGAVGSSQFAYFQIVLGYLAGYVVVATVLMPLYYRLNLVSIYTYLEQRFGFWSYKTGAGFFLLSRTLGAAIRLYLTATVLQALIYTPLGVPFVVNVFITIALIWVYTFKGGIKTIIWTDTFQTVFLVSAVAISVVLITHELGWDFTQLVENVQQSPYSQIFFWEDYKAKNHFLKYFFAGMFITITMTGLDQDLMQKNLTCKNIGEAQKNMFWFSVVLVIVNLLFLTLGALLYLYAQAKQIPLPAKSDELYPLLATQYLGGITGVFFLLGITASSYASADSALASLTTSFCIDFLEFKRRPEPEKQRLKTWVHIGFSILLLIIILICNWLNSKAVIDAVLTVASYTYGPLLGMYAFGLFTKWTVKDRLVLPICLLSPLLSWAVSFAVPQLTGGFQIGNELVLVNGCFTFLGLWAIKQ